MSKEKEHSLVHMNQDMHDQENTWTVLGPDNVFVHAFHVGDTCKIIYETPISFNLFDQEVKVIAIAGMVDNGITSDITVPVLTDFSIFYVTDENNETQKYQNADPELVIPFWLQNAKTLKVNEDTVFLKIPVDLPELS